MCIDFDIAKNFCCGDFSLYVGNEGIMPDPKKGGGKV